MKVGKGDSTECKKWKRGTKRVVTRASKAAWAEWYDKMKTKGKEKILNFKD